MDGSLVGSLENQLVVKMVDVKVEHSVANLVVDLVGKRVVLSVGLMAGYLDAELVMMSAETMVEKSEYHRVYLLVDWKVVLMESLSEEMTVLRRN